MSIKRVKSFSGHINDIESAINGFASNDKVEIVDIKLCTVSDSPIIKCLLIYILNN